MKTLVYKHKIPYFSSKLLTRYTGQLTMATLDIETMGLNPLYCPVVLTGSMTVDELGQATLTQHLAESLEEEPLVLEALKKDFENVDLVLTYNGKHFDMPYIEKRCKTLGIYGLEKNLYNLDLYQFLHGYSQLRQVLMNLKQKTVEVYMGLGTDRQDSISGGDSVILYEAYARCKDLAQRAHLEEKILLHNHDDVLQLYQLLPILKSVDMHNAFNGLGFPVGGENGWPTMVVTSQKVTSSSLVIKGKYYGQGFAYTSFDDLDRAYSCSFKEDKNFSFTLPTDKHKGNIFLSLPRYFGNAEDYQDMLAYPHYASDYLLVHDGQKANCLELNMFTKRFIECFMKNTKIQIIN